MISLIQKTLTLTSRHSAKEIQQIVEGIVNLSKENYQFLGMEMGDNHWGLMAELFLRNSTHIEVTDKKYGPGTAKYIGEALQYYSETKKA